MSNRVFERESGTLDKWRAVVAIPVKNEAERIAECLMSLSCQEWKHEPVEFEVLLFVNNSDDQTAAVARALAPLLTYPFSVIEAMLPPEDASAGGARRLAMDLGAAKIEAYGESGLLFTTDADSRVPPNWIDAACSAIEAGADAVAGTLVLDPEDEAALPASLKERGRLEALYESMVCELDARLHPQPHDPWPRHLTESGASFALTIDSFRAVGGVPNQALGEDRALAVALRDAGYRVRHAPEIIVTTSGRLVGRAAGGCADTMRARIEAPETPCDPNLRPVWQILVGPKDVRGPILHPKALPTQIALARLTITVLKISDSFRSTVETGIGWFRTNAQRRPDPAVSAELLLRTQDAESLASS